jgi:hypothetical protein
MAQRLERGEIRLYRFAPPDKERGRHRLGHVRVWTLDFRSPARRRLFDPMQTDGQVQLSALSDQRSQPEDSRASCALAARLIEPLVDAARVDGSDATVCGTSPALQMVPTGWSARRVGSRSRHCRLLGCWLLGC